jgi:acyl-CoA thioesterase
MNSRIIATIKQKMENEPYARKLGLELVLLEPGRATVEMTPQAENANLFGMIHGGAIFSLIDEAFQLACNSHGTFAVALNMTVTYHRPPDRHSKLRAKAEEVHCSRKTATYEIKVVDEKGALIASCLALAYRKGDPLPFMDSHAHVPEESDRSDVP